MEIQKSVFCAGEITLPTESFLVCMSFASFNERAIQWIVVLFRL